MTRKRKGNQAAVTIHVANSLNKYTAPWYPSESFDYPVIPPPRARETGLRDHDGNMTEDGEFEYTCPVIPAVGRETGLARWTHDAGCPGGNLRTGW